MSNVLAEWVAAGPVVTDGAWGTQLQMRGLDAGECPDAWNLTHPDKVEEVARAYVEAGSRIILTNTFRSTRVALEGYGLQEKVKELNREGVRISRAAAGGEARVVASIGPSGKMLMTGEVSEDALAAAFAEQAAELAAAGADALVVETMADIEEARLAVRAARATGLPVIASFVYDSGKNKDRTMMGNTIEQVAAAMEEEGASAVGANCGLGPEGFLPICRRLRAATKLPVWLKPNAGAPVIVDGQVQYRVHPDEFARHVRALVDEGANFVGGCCGSTPEFLRAAAGLISPCA